MKLFRCLNCAGESRERGAGEFAAESGVCRKCKLSGEHVVELECIHYDPPSGVPGRGMRHAACDDKIKIGQYGLMMTGEPSAVTCRACMKSPVWKLNAALCGLPTTPATLDHVTEPPTRR